MRQFFKFLLLDLWKTFAILTFALGVIFISDILFVYSYMNIITSIKSSIIPFQNLYFYNDFLNQISYFESAKTLFFDQLIFPDLLKVIKTSSFIIFLISSLLIFGIIFLIMDKYCNKERKKISLLNINCQELFITLSCFVFLIYAFITFFNICNLNFLINSIKDENLVKNTICNGNQTCSKFGDNNDPKIISLNYISYFYTKGTGWDAKDFKLKESSDKSKLFSVLKEDKKINEFYINGKQEFVILPKGTILNYSFNPSYENICSLQFVSYELPNGKIVNFLEHLKQLEIENKITYFKNFTESQFFSYNNGLSIHNLTKNNQELCDKLNNIK